MAARLNFLLWLQALLDSTAPPLRDEYDPERTVTALDVYGTSPSFPRLYSRLGPFL